MNQVSIFGITAGCSVRTKRWQPTELRTELYKTCFLIIQIPADSMQFSNSKTVSSLATATYGELYWTGDVTHHRQLVQHV